MAEQGSPVVTPSAGTPVVAIVDDDADLCATVAALLAENGFHPLPLADSAGFFAAAARQTVDLALIDLRLRGESGLTLAIRIRETMGIPIVMLTGRGDETDKIIGLETGADDYMMKPFNPRELIARLRAVLRRAGRATPQPPIAATASSGPLDSCGWIRPAANCWGRMAAKSR